MDWIMICGGAAAVGLFVATGWTFVAGQKTAAESPGQPKSNSRDAEPCLVTKNAEVLCNEAATLAAAEDYAGAVEFYSRAIQTNPFCAEAFCGRGNAYKALNQHVKALHDYTEAIHLNPHDAGVFQSRGAVYADMGRHEEAIEDYEAAMRINPDIITVAYKARQPAGR